MNALLVALGASVGAPARLLGATLFDRRYGAKTLHGGTLLVNLIGSAFLGWLVGHGAGTHGMTLFGTGFCGAFTTYSAVAVQSVDRGGLRGIGYAIVTVVGCLGIAWAGYALG